jgi:hypothetical protein
MDAPIESMELARDLDEDAIEVIGSWQDPSIFFVVNNLYVNPTKVINKDLLAEKLLPII